MLKKLLALAIQLITDIRLPQQLLKSQLIEHHMLVDLPVVQLQRDRSRGWWLIDLPLFGRFLDLPLVERLLDLPVFGRSLDLPVVRRPIDLPATVTLDFKSITMATAVIATATATSSTTILMKYRTSNS